MLRPHALWLSNLPYGCSVVLYLLRKYICLENLPKRNFPTKKSSLFHGFIDANGLRLAEKRFPGMQAPGLGPPL